MNKFVKFSLVFFFICGILLLILPIDWFPHFYDARYMGVAAFVCAAAIIFLPKILRVPPAAPEAEKKNKVADFFQFAVALVVMNNAMGDVGLYQLYKVGFEYDKFIHFLNPLLAVIVISIVLRDRFDIRVGRAILVSFLVVVISGVLWEVIEFASDALLGTHIYGVYGTDTFNDTMWDSICNVLGSLAGVLIMVFLEKENACCLKNF